jgi:hypothetical protein
MSKVSPSEQLGFKFGHVHEDTANVVNKEFRHEAQSCIVHFQKRSSHEVAESHCVRHHFFGIQSNFVGTLQSQQARKSRI